MSDLVVPKTDTPVNPEVVPETTLATEWRIMKDMARYAIASGFLPKTITRPEQAMVIMQKGKELGIQPMDALANIHVINGKAALSSELMLSLFLTRLKGARMRYLTPPEKAATICQVEISIDGLEPYKTEFSMEDAKRAGLLNNPSWQKYPAAMLRARAVSSAIRAYAPHAMSGCYLKEELTEGEEDGQNAVHR